jgi:predicted nuclease of predicted toxin-antitoxin system
MKLRGFGLLADENIDADVVRWLTDAGFDVQDVFQVGKQGASDVDLLRHAFAVNRVIVTHDADFGKLAILQREPVIGIVFLRPGHIDPAFAIGTLASVLSVDPDVTPPFILVARRTGDQVTIRIRSIAP